jgi:hypothetical protein
MIPVAGFLISGIAFTVGEYEVGRSLNNARRASDLADTSREFKSSLVQMRVRTREFAARPSKDQIKQFDAAFADGERTLSDLKKAVSDETQTKLPLQRQLAEIAAQFVDLTRNQKALGYSESEGTRARMAQAAARRWPTRWRAKPKSSTPRCGASWTTSRRPNLRLRSPCKRRGFSRFKRWRTGACDAAPMLPSGHGCVLPLQRRRRLGDR